MIDGAVPAIVGETVSNSPAAKAGLKPGDEIIAVNGAKIYSYDALLELEGEMTNGPVRPVTLTVHRDTNDFDLTLRATKRFSPPTQLLHSGLHGR